MGKTATKEKPYTEFTAIILDYYMQCLEANIKPEKAKEMTESKIESFYSIYDMGAVLKDIIKEEIARLTAILTR